MKKLFVILLAVAMTLSLAVMASAATFSPYVGGEFQLTYYSNGDTSPFSLDNGSFSMMKAYVQGRVEDADTNTWAQIGAKLTCWSAPGFDVLYSAGIKKVGGILDIQFSTDDYETTLRGQTPLNQAPAKFGGDPFFCNRLSNSFGFDVNTDNVTVNIGTTAGIFATVSGVKVPANELGKVIVAAGTFKFDAGKVHAGYAKLSDTNSNMIVGGEFKAGDAMTIKADYYMVNTGSSASTFQANVSLDEMKLAATLLYDMKNLYPGKDSTIGVGVEYSGIDKLTLGGKWIADDNLMEVYGNYKYGILDIKPGYAKVGTADGFFYLALHAGLW